MNARQWLRSAVYDAAVASLTADWYASVLERLHAGCRMLDVGIGTGTALLSHAAVIERKDLQIIGIDIDSAYVERCRDAVVQHGLAAASMRASNRSSTTMAGPTMPFISAAASC